MSTTYGTRTVRVARSRHLMVLGFTASLTVACGETGTPIAPSSGPSAVMVETSSTPYDSYSADVDVAFSGATAGITSVSNPTRGIGYHVSQRLDAYGRWVSDFSLGTYRASSEASEPGDSPPRIAQVSGYYSNLNPTMRDVNGGVVPMPEQPSVELTPSTADIRPGDSATSVNVPPPPPGASFSMASNSGALLARNATAAPTMAPMSPSGGARLSSLPTLPDPDAWVDRRVVTRAAAIRNRQRLEKLAGPGKRNAKGRLEFHSVRGDREVTWEFDEELGAVAEYSVSEAGVLRARTVNTYDRQPNGIAILTRVVTALMRQGDPSQSLVATINYRNVAATSQGGH